MAKDPPPNPTYQLWRDPKVKNPLLVVAMQVNVSYARSRRVDRALEVLKQAQKIHGKGIYLLPEYFLIDFLVDRKKMVSQAETVPGPSTEPFMKFAKKTGIYVAVGMFEKSDERGRPYNTIAIFGPEGLVGCYRKMHLWDSGNKFKDPAKEEFLLFKPGNELGLYQMYDYKVGVMICADGTYPEIPRALALNGADLLLYPNGRSVVGAEAEVAAKSNLLPIVVSNLLGDNGTIGAGSSRVIGPWGEVLASAVGVGYSPHGTARGEGWGAAELDMKKIKKFRNTYCERTGRRPELYSILTKKR